MMLVPAVAAPFAGQQQPHDRRGDEPAATVPFSERLGGPPIDPTGTVMQAVALGGPPVPATLPPSDQPRPVLVSERITPPLPLPVPAPPAFRPSPPHPILTKLVVKGLTLAQPESAGLAPSRPLAPARFDEDGLLQGTSAAGAAAPAAPRPLPPAQPAMLDADPASLEIDLAQAVAARVGLSASIAAAATAPPLLRAAPAVLRQSEPAAAGPLAAGIVDGAPPDPAEPDLDSPAPARAAVRPGPPIASMNPVMVALHAVEGGHKLLARLGEIDGDDRERLTGEITALLARHGLSATSITILARHRSATQE
jgi:hypothetical protein